MIQKKKVNLYIFAHQDDEVFAAAYINNQLAEGQKVFCIFVTNGQGNNTPSHVRKSESAQALTWLNIPKENLIFLSDTMEIQDLHLHENLSIVFERILQFAILIKPNKIWTLACEGGHPDHDCCAALALKISEQVPGSFLPIGFPAYRPNRWYCPISVGKLAQHQTIYSTTTLSKMDFWRFLRMIFFYPSQWKTWIIIGPLLFISLAHKKSQPVTQITRETISLALKNKSFLYLLWFKVDQNNIEIKISEFLNAPAVSL